MWWWFDSYGRKVTRLNGRKVNRKLVYSSLKALDSPSGVRGSSGNNGELKIVHIALRLLRLCGEN
jgi:hypothetical protein